MSTTNPSGFRDETVADAADRLEELRGPGAVLHVPSQPHDEVIDRPRIDILRQAPDFPKNRGARHGLTRLRDQVSKQVALHDRQSMDLVSYAQLHRREINRPGGKRIKVPRCSRPGIRDCRFLLVPAPPPNETVHAGQKDGQVKRLGEIVIGACFESTQNVACASARGQHENRNELPHRSKLRRNLESVFAGQHHIENNGVEWLPIG